MHIVALSFLCFALFASCTGDVRQKPAVAVPEFIPPRPTATPRPTLEPRPTATPRATATPRPTRTPVPVAEPTFPEATPTPLLRERESRREPARPVRRRVQPEAAEERDGAPSPDVEAIAPAPSSDSPAKRLRSIAAERRNSDPGSSYALGSGDLLTITVFDLEELNRKVRVSRRGDIQLPLIGTVRAAGRTESDLARDIATRLERDYLQDPQVDVFVEEYRSQQVAVTGAVAEPGLYSLTRDRSTILDMISEAGGLTADAGGIIEFIPARRGRRSSAFEMAKSASAFTEELAGQGIQIELNDLMRGSNRSSVNVPVVAGDVIFVPEAGSFAIDGWVDKPGTYPLTRGMTVLAALSAGGGPLFPAKLSQVELLRATSTRGESREVIEVDVEAIKEGRMADIELRAGDVVRVPANALLVPPWAVYQLFRDLIRLGASVPVA